MDAIGWPTEVGLILFNYSHPDPVLRQLFLNKNFRVALSYGINREQVNEVVFRGAFHISQVSPPFNSKYGGDDPIYRRYTEFDQDKANQLSTK